MQRQEVLANALRSRLDDSFDDLMYELDEICTEFDPDSPFQFYKVEETILLLKAHSRSVDIREIEDDIEFHGFYIAKSETVSLSQLERFGTLNLFWRHWRAKYNGKPYYESFCNHLSSNETPLKIYQIYRRNAIDQLHILIGPQPRTNKHLRFEQYNKYQISMGFTPMRQLYKMLNPSCNCFYACSSVNEVKLFHRIFDCLLLRNNYKLNVIYDNRLLKNSGLILEKALVIVKYEAKKHVKMYVTSSLVAAGFQIIACHHQEEPDIDLNNNNDNNNNNNNNSNSNQNRNENERKTDNNNNNHNNKQDNSAYVKKVAMSTHIIVAKVCLSSFFSSSHLLSVSV